MTTANVFRERLSANLGVQMVINRTPTLVNAIHGNAAQQMITRAQTMPIAKLCAAMFQTTISGARQTMSKTGTLVPV